MGNNDLTEHDWKMILESLKYTKKRFEEYDEYPDIKFKKERVDEVDQLIKKISSLIKF